MMKILQPILLQFQQVTAGSDVAAPTEALDSVGSIQQAEEKIPIIDLFISSWPIMIPLLILSIVAVYIWVERYTAIQRASKLNPAFMPEIKSAVSKGDFTNALSLCEKNNTPTSRMMHKGISRLGRPLDDIAKSIENVGRLEVSNLEKNLSILATISGAAPMIGFLGTVIGMMITFHQMAKGGNGGIQIEDLSSGIMYAMATTVAGLIVGIIAYLGYNILVSKIDKVVREMEDRALEFMDLLHQPVQN